MMSLLITRLDQHKIIINNLWLKRNQILIDSTNNRLISSSNIQILKLIVWKTSSQSAFHWLESSEICEMKRKNLKFMSMIILKRTTNLKSNESSSILMKQDMSMSLLIINLTKADRFSNSLRFHASELT